MSDKTIGNVDKTERATDKPIDRSGVYQAIKKPQEMLKTERGKVMMFIDGNNLFYTSQLMGIEIDYIHLVKVLVGNAKLVRAYFYAGIDYDHSTSMGWLYFMKRTGFKMVTKPLQTFVDGTKKANCDVELVVDMVNQSDHYDTAIVVSGDGDLTYAIQNVCHKGKQVEVVGYKGNTNDTLINAADRFVDLDSIKQQITKSIRENNNQNASNNNNSNKFHLF